MLTSHWWAYVAFAWEEFHANAQSTILYNDFEKHLYKIVEPRE